MHVVQQLRDRVRRIAHRTGSLAAYHRIRNRRWLTVLCLHRVLRPSDPRWHDADREWTITVDQLLDCVAFAKRHFHTVSLDEVLDARRRSTPLPPRPVLFTFDDGWADNEEYALPVLEAANVPGVIFVTSDAVGRSSPLWFEMLRMARIGGRIDQDTWHALWTGARRDAPPPLDERGLETLITTLSAFDGERREALIAPFAPRLEDGHQHMLSARQLRRLRARGFAIGAHGRTHQPLSTCRDLDDELVQPRRRLEEIVGHPVTTLALPHGRGTPDVIARAKAAGYEAVFTGRRELSPTDALPFSIGRAPITPEASVDDEGHFLADRLAVDLFRCRHISKEALNLDC